MIKYIRPDLTERQLGKCVFQLKGSGDAERDGRISLHELRTALQVKVPRSGILMLFYIPDE